jgi:hypothetical protein
MFQRESRWLVGFPDEIAASILWLLCDDAGCFTGSILDVAGGR